MKTKLRKIFYVPGLISAIIIPLVFWHLGSEKFEDINISYISIGLPFKYDPEISLEKQTYTFEPYRNWNYKKIKVEPNSARKNSKYYITQLKKLQKNNIKETGIEFISNDENSYDDFVSILNDFAIANQLQYGLDLDKTGHLFAGHQYIDPNQKEYKYTSLFGTNDTIKFGDESDYYKGFQKFQFQISELPKQAYYFIFSFLIFLQISVLGIIRKQF